MPSALSAFAFLVVSLAAPAAPTERMVVLPLDTSVVTLDRGLAPAALVREEEASASPARVLAEEFHPRFREAVTRAARRVQVTKATEDSAARYVLRIDSLGFSLRTRAVGRRFVPPSPPGFDPATGEMTPGERRGHSEGPGWMHTLEATAAWTLRDRAGDSVLAKGISGGAAVFRGEARRGDWDLAARELAKAVLRGTPFSPFR